MNPVMNFWNLVDKYNNPAVLYYVVHDMFELTKKYGKYRVLWAIEQMEKKYDIHK